MKIHYHFIILSTIGHFVVWVFLLSGGWTTLAFSYLTLSDLIEHITLKELNYLGFTIASLKFSINDLMGTLVDWNELSKISSLWVLGKFIKSSLRICDSEGTLNLKNINYSGKSITSIAILWLLKYHWGIYFSIYLIQSLCNHFFSLHISILDYILFNNSVNWQPANLVL